MAPATPETVFARLSNTKAPPEPAVGPSSTRFGVAIASAALAVAWVTVPASISVVVAPVPVVVMPEIPATEPIESTPADPLAVWP